MLFICFSFPFLLLFDDFSLEELFFSLFLDLDDACCFPDPLDDVVDDVVDVVCTVFVVVVLVVSATEITGTVGVEPKTNNFESG